MTLIDKETIRAEIERLIEINKTKRGFPAGTYCAIRIDAYEHLLNFLDSLPEQPGEGLDKARFLKVLDQWEEHAIRGMRNGATAYHQGKITLITDLRDWITREG